MSLKVNVLFFGATAGVVGKRLIEMDFPEDLNAKQAFDRVVEEFPTLAKHKLLCSVNQKYAVGDEALNEGDELAIFTAVSGG
jgi:molybdopterin converting factor small subunit